MGVEELLKFNPAEEHYALSHAYVPEQIPALMTAISHATPFLIEGYLGFAKDNWLIFVGYPLAARFDETHCERIIVHILELHHPDYLWFIGPRIPSLLLKSCHNRQSDQYLRLELSQWKIKPSLRREVNQADKSLIVEYAHIFSDEHQSLVDELMQREKLPPLVAELYRAMPDYIDRCNTALVLNARDRHGKLAAFFVIECAAEGFDTYVLGCHSKANYVPHASDFLFAEMIANAQKRGKTSINLGLGVNAGIRRFKMKWGGTPYLKYEFCECYYGPPQPLLILEALLEEKF